LETEQSQNARKNTRFSTPGQKGENRWDGKAFRHEKKKKLSLGERRRGFAGGTMEDGTPKGSGKRRKTM